MISIQKFETIINIFMGIILCIVLSIVALILNNGLSLETLILSFISSFTVSYTVSDLLPLKAMGDKIAKSLGLKEGKGIFFFVSTFIITFIMVCFISFLMVLLNVGFKPFLFAAWFSGFPILLLAGYIIELIFLPLAVKIAISLTKNEEMASDLN